MRKESLLFIGVACVLVYAGAPGCGGKTIETVPGGAGGSTVTGGSGGAGGTSTGGSGGTVTGGMGGGGFGGTMTGGMGGGGMGGGGFGGTMTGGMGGGGFGGTMTGGMGGGGMGGAGGGACWNYLPALTDCRQCLDMSCCGEVINCFQDPDGFCPIAVDCFEKCPTGDPYACAQSCDGGNFSVPFNDLFNCGAANCPAQCMNATQPSCAVQSGSPACDECINTQCAAECNACANNPSCMDLLACIQPCSSYQCQQDCINQFPAGVDDLLAFLAQDGCLATNCGAPCGF